MAAVLGDRSKRLPSALDMVEHSREDKDTMKLPLPLAATSRTPTW
jgi:hypothetical protein